MWAHELTSSPSAVSRYVVSDISVSTASAVGSDYGSSKFQVPSTIMSPFIPSIEPWGLVGTSSLKLHRIKL